MSPTHTIRRLAGGTAVLTAVGATAGLLASELRRRRELAADADYQALSQSPLHGRPLTIRSADRTQLHAEVFGSESAPTVVLFPGWTEELHYFDLLTRGLCDRGFRVVACDLRGQGDSGEPVGADQRIERYGEDVEAVLAATCRGRDVIVGGHSMGAMSVISWAAGFEVSHRARACTLINTGVAELVLAARVLPALPAALRTAIGTRFVLGSAARQLPLSTPWSRALTRYVGFGPDATAGQVALYEPMRWHTPPASRAGAGLTLSHLDLSRALDRLAVPTLVVAGDCDRLTPPAHAEQIAAGLPDLAELLVLARTGHMAPLERPQELADAFLRLARRVELMGD